MTCGAIHRKRSLNTSELDADCTLDSEFNWSMPHDQHYEGRRRALRQRVLLQISALLAYLVSILSLVAEHSIPTPYHTSALTGEAWVLELMTGHPGRIRCELGVSIEVFHALVTYLREIGIDRSRYVSIEEQLAIFLYMAVTGLTIRHVGERFQRSNETISK